MCIKIIKFKSFLKNIYFLLFFQSMEIFLKLLSFDFGLTHANNRPHHVRHAKYSKRHLKIVVSWENFKCLNNSSFHTNWLVWFFHMKWVFQRIGIYFVWACELKSFPYSFQPVSHERSHCLVIVIDTCIHISMEELNLKMVITWRACFDMLESIPFLIYYVWIHF